MANRRRGFIVGKVPSGNEILLKYWHRRLALKGGNPNTACILFVPAAKRLRRTILKREGISKDNARKTGASLLKKYRKDTGNVSYNTLLGFPINESLLHFARKAS